MKPKLIIGSPMCTMFSNLQALSGWSDEKQRRWCDAKEHVNFMVKIYQKQVEEGRWFLHEHPASASSWDLEEVRVLSKTVGVTITEADQCMYGLTWVPNGKLNKAGKKKTKFMTNSQEIAKML